MPSNRFRSTSFAEAGQSLGKGLSGLGVALEAINERNALEAQNQAFGDFASLLQKVSRGDNPEAYDALVFQGYNVFGSNPNILESLNSLVGFSTRPLTKDQKDKNKRLEEFERKERERDLLKIKDEITDLNKPDPTPQEIEDNYIMSHREDFPEEVVQAIIAKRGVVSGVVTRTPKKTEKSPEELEEEVKAKIIFDTETKALFSTQITPESKRAILEKRGVKDIEFIAIAPKKDLVEGREDIQIDLGIMHNLADQRGTVGWASRNQIIDRIEAIQESMLPDNYGSMRLTPGEIETAKKDLSHLALAIGERIPDTSEVVTPVPRGNAGANEQVIISDARGMVTENPTFSISRDLKDIIDLEMSNIIQGGVSEEEAIRVLSDKLQKARVAVPSALFSIALESVLGDPLDFDAGNIKQLIEAVRADTSNTIPDANVDDYFNEFDSQREDR